MNLSLPRDVNSKIFIDYLSENERINCGNACKGLEQIVFSNCLSHLFLPPSDTPRSDVMGFYKKYCQFFLKRLPLDFNIKGLTKVIDVKAAIDARLKSPDEHGKPQGKLDQTLLAEAWCYFMHQIAPVENCFISIDIQPQPTLRYRTPPIENEKAEVHYFVTAGAKSSRMHPDVFGPLISRPWCSKETVQMLLKHNFRVTTSVIQTACTYQKFDDLVPKLLVSAGKLDLYELFKVVKPENGPVILENYLQRVQVNAYEVRGAIENGYSEEFVAKMIERCTERRGDLSSDMTPYHVRLGLEKRFSERLIFNMIDKCPKGFHEYHVRLAIYGNYSSDLINKLLTKFQPKSYDYYIVPGNISDAMEADYPEDLIAFLMEKVHSTRLKEALEQIVKRGLFPDIVKRYLPQTEGNLDPYVLHNVAGKYEEDLFLQLFNRTDQSKLVLRCVSINDVLENYSAKSALLLLDKGIEIFDSTLGNALAFHYSEKVILKILEKISTDPDSHVSYVSSEDLEKAKAMNYSAATLKLMKEKTMKSCIIS